MPCYICSHCNKCGMYSTKLGVVCGTCGEPIKPGANVCPKCGDKYAGNIKTEKIQLREGAAQFYDPTADNH